MRHAKACTTVCGLGVVNQRQNEDEHHWGNEPDRDKKKQRPEVLNPGATW